MLKLRTTLAEAAAVRSWAKRLYSSSMYSGGSRWAAGGPRWGLRAVRFMLDSRKWLRRSRASSRGLSASLWGPRGLHVLQHAAVSSRTSSLRTERRDTLMAERRSGGEERDPKTRRSRGGETCGRLVGGGGRLAAVGDNEDSAFAPADLAGWL